MRIIFEPQDDLRSDHLDPRDGLHCDRVALRILYQVLSCREVLQSDRARRIDRIQSLGNFGRVDDS